MTLKELHHFTFKELGVDPRALKQYRSRIDNVTVKYARIIFCSVARELGHKSVEIGDYIERETCQANNDIRQLRSMAFRDDFISRSVVENYKMVLTKVEEL